MITDENTILKAMQALDISREEALEMLQADAEIDKGAKLFELTDAQKKVQKQMRKTVKTVSPNGKKVERTLKINKNRELILTSIIELLNNNFQIENLERPEKTTNQVRFKFKDDNFKIVISKERGKVN